MEDSYFLFFPLLTLSFDMRWGWIENCAAGIDSKKKKNQTKATKHKNKQINMRTSNLVILLRKRAPVNQRVHRNLFLLPSSFPSSLPPSFLSPSLSFLSFIACLFVLLSSFLALPPLQKRPPEIMVVAVQASRGHTGKSISLASRTERRPWELESERGITKRRITDKDPLVLCMNWQNFWAHC